MPYVAFVMSRAAYKGFADTVRLLLFRDSSQGKQDKEGFASNSKIAMSVYPHVFEGFLIAIWSSLLWFLPFPQINYSVR